jgi:uncharacterized protein with GYD domain
MKISAADADRRDADSDLSRLGFACGSFNDIETAFVVPNRRFHDFPLVARSLQQNSAGAIIRPAFGKEARTMATYIMFSTLTDEGRKTLKERPERLREVNQEIERMGARVVNQFAVLGIYDFVNIIEAPSNEVIARISVELGARGTVQLTTLPAISIDAFTSMVKDSKTT